MGKYRRIPTISGNEPADPLFEAEFAPDGSDLVLDLHGRTVDESRAELDRFLDAAIVADFKAVKIIHGKGTGALARFVSEYLRTDKRVKASRPSNRQIGAAVVAHLKGG